MELTKTPFHQFIRLISIFSKTNKNPQFFFFNLFLLDQSYEAATLALSATEKFFNDLRKELGDENFDRLFAIHPTMDELEKASQGIAQMRKFQFFTSSLSSGLSMSSRLIGNMRQAAKQRWDKVRKSVFSLSDHPNLGDISFRRRRRTIF